MHGTTTTLDATQAEQVDGGFFFGVGGNYEHARPLANGHQIGIATDTHLERRIVDAYIGEQAEAVVE
jgi:hypothetical protein